MHLIIPNTKVLMFLHGDFGFRQSPGFLIIILYRPIDTSIKVFNQSMGVNDKVFISISYI